MNGNELYDATPRRGADHLWGVAVVLMVIIGWAFYQYHFQFSEGLGVTGLNKPVFWGLYIANFIFWVGLSAGGIAVSALVHLMDKKEMKPVAIMAEIMAASFLVIAASFIIMDLGRPTYMLKVFQHPHFSSPLLWDVTVISSYLFLCLALLYFSARQQIVRRIGHIRAWKPVVLMVTLGRTRLSPDSLETDHRLLTALAIVSIPAAVALHSVTAWILGLVKGQPGWNTPILAPLFIASALVSGFAAVTLGVIVGRKLFKFPVAEEVVHMLGRYLVVAILVLMYLLFSEFLTVGYSGTLSHLEVFDAVLWGRFSGIFWFDAIVGILVPLLLLTLPWKQSVFTVGVASLLVVVGVFAERTYLLLPALMRPNSLTGAISSYHPTLLEWSLMAGAWSLGCLLFLSGMGLIFGRPPRAAREAYVATGIGIEEMSPAGK